MGDFENITGCSGEYLDIPRDERKETGEKWDLACRAGLQSQDIIWLGRAPYMRAIRSVCSTLVWKYGDEKPFERTKRNCDSRPIWNWIFISRLGGQALN